jgi:hypothetical protein
VEAGAGPKDGGDGASILDWSPGGRRLSDPVGLGGPARPPRHAPAVWATVAPGSV